MPDLTTGTLNKTTGAAQLDSMFPLDVIASKTLVPGTDEMVMVDPSGGNVILTLPPLSNGIHFCIKRTSNGANSVSITPDGLDTIDNVNKPFILGNENEFVDLIGNASNGWQILGRRTFAVAAIQFLLAGTTTQGITTSYTKIDAWDVDAFSTPDRVEGDQANNRIIVQDVQNNAQDGYRVAFAATIQYQNNVDFRVKIFVGGVEQILGTSNTGKGSTDVPIEIEGIIGVPSPGPVDIDVRIEANSANTMTYIQGMALTVERIGG